MIDSERPSRHVPVEDRAQVKAFASELKALFDSVGMSQGAFCRVNPTIDKGTLSRYLNGKRVPRDRWLLDRLFALRVEAGTPLNDQARDHLVEL
ncbi:hypothetical protein [Actinomadura rupiterrae]|uniref:hypothetical protein n=1 Tax=Actinomadura rupiterrae TaxID=559627 RepID=UPI0020A24724|nr:hypothetical protein [Actinomadura rupiterrae]MCP2340668.1 hypothetical protein [Actinomadura rupiterrae]